MATLTLKNNKYKAASPKHEFTEFLPFFLIVYKALGFRLLTDNFGAQYYVDVFLLRHQ